MPKSERAEPSIENDRKDTVEPRCRKSNTETAEPTLAKLLIDIEEPKYRKSSTDTADPILIIPKTES